MKSVLLFLLVSLLAGATGCGDDAGSDTARLPDVDFDYFVQNVQPILQTRCAFFACHGNPKRSFQIYQEVRFRSNPNPNWLLASPAPLTAYEVERNFTMAAGTLIGFENPEGSLLFSKPLQGGTRHGGATLFGGPDVFLSRDDPEYREILRWARGARLPRSEGER